MKKLLLTQLLTISIFLGFSQEWISKVDETNSPKKDMNFYEIQKAFYDYYAPYEVINGTYKSNGEQVKIPGWKQFKRWEWYWESRINRSTGLIESDQDIDKIYSQQQSIASKSPSGNWQALGPVSSTGGYAGIGRLNCVAFHPTDNNTIWVGSPSGGLWKTTDGGNTWAVLTDNNAVLGVSDIVIPSDYSTSKTIYIATGDKDGGSMWSLGGGGSADNNSIGVLKSSDDGATWQTTGLSYIVSDKKRIGRLLVHPSNNSILFAATSDGIKKTLNGGTTWTTVYSYTRQYTGDMVIDMEFKPGDPTVMYASTKEYGYAPKILKSIDSGETWTAANTFLTSDYRVEIAVTANGPDYIYCIVANTSSALRGIFRSTDSGATFTELITGAVNKAYLGYYSDGSGDNKGQGGYDLCIAASPIDKNVAFFGGINTWKTTDGGVNWTISNMWTSYSGYNKSGAPVAHADKHGLAYRADGTLFECNDGGIYKTANGGTTWTDISNGLTISQIYRLGV